MKTLSARLPLMLLALCLVLLTFFQARPAAASTTKCCLDDWQGGGVCQPGYRLYAVCGTACNNCGTFTCVPDTTFCLR
jgi:hypothetical protein